MRYTFKSLSVIIVFLLLTGLLLVVRAYDVETHRAISAVAINRPDCVLSTSNAHPFLQEELLMPNGIATPVPGRTSFGPQTLTLGGWVMFGAEHEDDSFLQFGEHFDLIPRSLHHFYNPLKNEGLTDTALWGFPTGSKGMDSLDWAWDSINAPNRPRDDINLWDWKRARVYESVWLTAQDEESRNRYCAETFRALGQVIHLLQDAAQPQHTRNDAHTYWWLGGREAPYEHHCKDKYGTIYQLEELEARAIEPIPNFTTINPSPFDSYIPRNLRAFWDTEQYQGQSPGRGFAGPLGLAEYSNVNFVTNRTMFTGETMTTIQGMFGPAILRIKGPGAGVDSLHEFPYPKTWRTNIDQFLFHRENTVYRAGQEIRQLRLPWDISYETVNITSPDYIPDAFTEVQSVRSSFKDSGYIEIGLTPANYEAHAQKLLPKAISYSAGLVNYFFRSRLGVDVSWDDTNKRVRLQITNKSIGQNEAFKNGNWYLFVDDADRVRMPVGSLNTSQYTRRLAQGASFTATFTPEGGGGTYTLMFKGTIGEEHNTAIAVKRFDFRIATVGPSFFLKLPEEYFVGSEAPTFIGTGGEFSIISATGCLDHGGGPKNKETPYHDYCGPGTIPSFFDGTGLNIFEGSTTRRVLILGYGQTSFQTLKGVEYRMGITDTYAGQDNSGSWTIIYSLKDSVSEN